jgi:hypothetical protein
LADILLVVLEPIHKKRKNYLSNKAAIRRILQAGSERARSFAAETMVKLKKAMSFSL